VVAWVDRDPVVVLGDRAVRLGASPTVLVRAPDGSDELQIATLAAGTPSRVPGRPDPGPFLARYRSALPWIWVLAVAVAATVAVWLIRRRWFVRR
jgi:hypothetical protein